MIDWHLLLSVRRRDSLQQATQKLAETLKKAFSQAEPICPALLQSRESFAAAQARRSFRLINLVETLRWKMSLDS